jgi:hypothetical protein
VETADASGQITVQPEGKEATEVIPAPLVLTLDQSEYDAADQVAIGTIAVAKRVSPAQVN